MPARSGRPFRGRGVVSQRPCARTVAPTAGATASRPSLARTTAEQPRGKPEMTRKGAAPSPGLAVNLPTSVPENPSGSDHRQSKVLRAVLAQPAAAPAATARISEVDRTGRRNSWTRSRRVVSERAAARG